LVTDSVRAQESCSPAAEGPIAVRTVLDGRTLILSDGREVRLAGIEVEPDTRAALAAYLSDGPILLKPLSTDRHGRIVAFAFAGTRPSAQRHLISLGLARVAARVGDAGCAAELFAAERTARSQRLGLWGNPHYVKKSENPAEIAAERGRFTVVEGRVLSVRESGGVIYVNFGRRWSEDFTVTVLKRAERLFSDAGVELKKLAGRTVRIRGYVEERGGPWIEATRPEQIEIAERQ
jgi:endonuclease YncB( thermonuclease family)